MGKEDKKEKKLAKKEKKLAKKLKKKEKKLKKKLKKLKKNGKRGSSSSSSSSSSASSSAAALLARAPADPRVVGSADPPVKKRAVDEEEASTRPAAKALRVPVEEESRESVGLVLVGERYAQQKPGSSAIWEYPLRDEPRRCFAGRLSNQLNASCLKRFEELVRDGSAWHQPKRPRTGELLPRKTDWMTAERCRCAYKYGGVEVDPTEFPDWMVEIMETVMPLCGLRGQGRWPNCCNLNLYDDGGMSVGWHADDEDLFQGKVGDCAIISLSLGQARTFELQLAAAEGQQQPAQRMTLQSGDLMTMEGLVQKHYLHRVPKERAGSPRINLTWRWIKSHQPRCPFGR